MRATRQTERLIAGFCAAQRLSTRTSPEMDKRVLTDVLSAYKKPTTSKPAPAGTNIGRIIMQSPLTKLALAAVVVIACGIGLSFWRTTGSGIVLADVLTQIEKAKSFRCKASFTMAGEPVPGRSYRLEMHGTMLSSQEWGRKGSGAQIDPNGREVPQNETYFLLQKKTSIQIAHPARRYTRTELDDAEFQRMREGLTEDADPGWWLREIMKCKYETLGRSTLGGVEVEGFRTTDPNCSVAAHFTDPQVDAKLWVDVKTRMPVCIEAHVSGRGRTGGRMSNDIVLHDIQFDVPVTASDFEPPAVPEGYLVVVDRLPGPITEEGTIEGLRQCAEWLGKYPGSISVPPPEGIQAELQGSNSAGATRLKDELKGLTEQDRVNRLMEAGTPLRRAHRFFAVLTTTAGKDPAYYGKTVTPKDTDKVLLRWKLSDKEYRVIFGDLHAETVSPEKLAELEKALPK